MKQSEEIGEKQFSDLGSRGGQISPLMHVPPWQQALQLILPSHCDLDLESVLDRPSDLVAAD